MRADIAQAALDNSEDRYTKSRALGQSAFELANQLDDQATLYRAAWYRFRETHSTKDRQSVLRIAREFSANIPSELPIFTHAQILNSSAWIFMSEGDRAAADELRTQLRILADDTREPAPVAFSNMLSVWFLTVDGQLESAMSQLADNEGILALPGRVGLFPSAVRLRLSTYLGKTKDELHEILQRPGTTDRGHGIRTGAITALCEAHMGNFVEAAIDVDRLLNELDIEDIEAAPINLLAWYFETAVLIGHKDAASLLSRQFEPIADLVMANLAMTCVARLLGGAAALLGDPEKAREYYILALEVTSKMQFRPEMALTRLQLTELLLENYPDERAEAMDRLDLAISEFRDMKMQPSLERALSHRDILKA